MSERGMTALLFGSRMEVYTVLIDGAENITVRLRTPTAPNGIDMHFPAQEALEAGISMAQQAAAVIASRQMKNIPETDIN